VAASEPNHLLRHPQMDNLNLTENPSRLAWAFPGAQWELGDFPKIMGILNVTPDSFSDGGRFLDPARAIDQAAELFARGADILDIGGESTRPGAATVSIEDELQRVLPVIERVAKKADGPISVDTTRAEIARRALDLGAVIVNDISGLTFDSKMPLVCAEAKAGVICMHIQGTPATMQLNPQYDDVVAEVASHLSSRLDALEQAGIAPERIVVDPGIGFGKAAQHNLDLLRNVGQIRSLGRPVLIGHSRKRFLGKLLGRPLDELLAGTVGVSIALAIKGVDILRVHDVQAVKDALLAFHAIIKK
jgi:dihydropteroate synthase